MADASVRTYDRSGELAGAWAVSSPGSRVTALEMVLESWVLRSPRSGLLPRTRPDGPDRGGGRRGRPHLPDRRQDPLDQHTQRRRTRARRRGAGKTLWTSTPSGAGLVRGVEVLDRTGPPEFAWLGEGVAGVVDLGGRVANTWRGEWTAMAIRPGSPRTLLLAERGGGIRSIPERKRAGDSLPGKELLHVGEPVARMAAGIAGDRQVLVLVTASGRILVADLPPRPMPAEPPGPRCPGDPQAGWPARRGASTGGRGGGRGGPGRGGDPGRGGGRAGRGGAERPGREPDAPSSRSGDTLPRGARGRRRWPGGCVPGRRRTGPRSCCCWTGGGAAARAACCGCSPNCWRPGSRGGRWPATTRGGSPAWGARGGRC